MKLERIVEDRITRWWRLAVLVLVVVVCLGHRGRWLLGLVLIMALAAAATPPDPASMLLCAVPAGIVYVLGVLAWRAVPGRPAG